MSSNRGNGLEGYYIGLAALQKLANSWFKEGWLMFKIWVGLGLVQSSRTWVCLKMSVMLQCPGSDRTYCEEHYWGWLFICIPDAWQILSS